MTTHALMLQPITHDWTVSLTDGRELARFSAGDWTTVRTGRLGTFEATTAGD